MVVDVNWPSVQWEWPVNENRVQWESMECCVHCIVFHLELKHNLGYDAIQNGYESFLLSNYTKTPLSSLPVEIHWNFKRNEKSIPALLIWEFHYPYQLPSSPPFPPSPSFRLSYSSHLHPFPPPAFLNSSFDYRRHSTGRNQSIRKAIIEETPFRICGKRHTTSIVHQCEANI